MNDKIQLISTLNELVYDLNEDELNILIRSIKRKQKKHQNKDFIFGQVVDSNTFDITLREAGIDQTILKPKKNIIKANKVKTKMFPWTAAHPIFNSSFFSVDESPYPAALVIMDTKNPITGEIKQILYEMDWGASRSMLTEWTYAGGGFITFSEIAQKININGTPRQAVPVEINGCKVVATIWDANLPLLGRDVLLQFRHFYNPEDQILYMDYQGIPTWLKKEEDFITDIELCNNLYQFYEEKPLVREGRQNTKDLEETYYEMKSHVEQYI